jgi:hypothetical protein
MCGGHDEKQSNPVPDILMGHHPKVAIQFLYSSLVGAEMALSAPPGKLWKVKMRVNYKLCSLAEYINALVKLTHSLTHSAHECVRSEERNLLQVNSRSAGCCCCCTFMYILINNE